MPRRDIDDERRLRLRKWVIHRHEEDLTRTRAPAIDRP
jgi:hypothetical protein